ncbi:MAG: hypothetical protein ACI4R6_02555, partial [Lachnospiraceae bacterium]
LFHVLIQLDVIMLLFVWLFGIAPYSAYYSRWDTQVKEFVGICSVANAIVFTLLIVLTVFCLIKSGNFKKPDLSIVFAFIIFTVHILIRVKMLGSYQVSDAREYFTRLDAVASYPNGMLFNTLESGFICGHIAHGYIFMNMLGQLLDVESGMGFQYSNMIMGAMAAVCLFYIFKRLFPKSKSFACALAAFIVSIQPMFLGLSTSAQMEYTIAILFIYVICSYVTKHYILMAFWLVMLGTCKETGTMMAFSVLGLAILYAAAWYIRQKGGFKNAWKSLSKWQIILIVVFIAACIAVFVKVLFLPVWGGTRIIDVLKIGGSGRMNFQFDKTHFLMKVRQLYILNFSWLWAVLLVVGLVVNYAVPAVRKRKAIDGRILSFIIIQYVVYTGFLLFFLEAKQPRYNILSDVLLLFLTMTVLIKVLDKLVIFVPVSTVVGGLALIETFLTIDPVTQAVFTRINTGGIPMVWTAATKSELEYMDINVSDFGYYNYQYTFADRAVDRMLDQVNYQGWFRIVSSFEEGTEDQFASTDLIWDSQLRKRTYRRADEEARYHSVQRISYIEEVEGWNHDARCIFVEMPWCRNNVDKAMELLSEIYIIEGPFTISEGRAGAINYYIMYIR